MDTTQTRPQLRRETRRIAKRRKANSATVDEEAHNGRYVSVEHSANDACDEGADFPEIAVCLRCPLSSTIPFLPAEFRDAVQTHQHIYRVYETGTMVPSGTTCAVLVNSSPFTPAVSSDQS